MGSATLDLEETETFNIKKEDYKLSLTEWEIDAVVNALKNYWFKGERAYLLVDLQKKINEEIKRK